MLEIVSSNNEILDIAFSLLSTVIALFSLILTYKISGKISIISTEKIGKNIDKYLSRQLPYPVTLFRSDNEKYEVTNLRDFLYAKDNGYYSNTTIGIREESYLDSMITVLNLLENARNNFYKPTKVKFIDLIQSLPATLLDFSTPPEEESELKGKSIKDLLKENKVQINKDSLDGIFVELLDNSFDSESCLHHKAGSLFSQLYRADFNGDGKEEILFSVHCFSGGTLNTVKTLCLGYRSFLGIWKKWDLIDIDKIHIEHYSNIFPSEWQN